MQGSEHNPIQEFQLVAAQRETNKRMVIGHMFRQLKLIFVTVQPKFEKPSDCLLGREYGFPRADVSYVSIASAVKFN